jgi:hypothetical protein
MLEANNERAGFSSLKKIFSKKEKIHFEEIQKVQKTMFRDQSFFGIKNLELSTAPKTY